MKFGQNVPWVSMRKRCEAFDIPKTSPFERLLMTKIDKSSIR